MPYGVLPIVLILTLSLSSHAQAVNDEINLVKPDLKKLEWFTFESVNKLRQEKNLRDLVWDDVLYRAAKDHADFLRHAKQLSHFEKTKGKETPAARVKLHGGFVFTSTGENLVRIPLGVQHTVHQQKRSTITHSSSAEVMAAAWKGSPGHYRNIISEAYNCTAVAVSYDSLTRLLVAVQVFGFTSVPTVASELPDYSAELLQMKVPDLPYNLKKYKGSNVKNIKANNRFMKLKVDRGYLTGSFRQAKKIFKGRSGIAQEFIPLAQFDSSSVVFTKVPNRRNGLYELNGTLSKPVYRREMLRYSRKNTNRGYLINLPILKIKKRTRQFIFPLHGNAPGTASNLFLIRQKQLQVFRTYSMVPWELFDMEFPRLEFKNSFRAKESTDRYKVTYVYDTIQLQIFYPSKVVTIDEQHHHEIESSFSRIRGKIVAVEAEAFASIEGDENDNYRIAKERMYNFMLVLNPYLDTANVTPTIVAHEQWAFFDKQIVANHLSVLKNLPMHAKRKYVNEHKQDTLLSALLDAQRYTRIKIVWRKELLEVLPGKSALQEYELLKKSVESVVKPKAKVLQQLLQAQVQAYYQLAHQDVVTEVPDLPAFLTPDRYPVFAYHDLIFRYTVLHSVSDRKFYNQLHELAKSKYFPSLLKGQAIYNNHVLIYKNYIQGTLDSIMPDPQWDCRAFTASELHLRRVRVRCRRSRDFIGKDLIVPDDYFILKELRAVISNGQREKINNFPAEDLWRYYYLNTIKVLHNSIPLPGEIFSLLPKFKAYFHPNDALLTDEERVRLALFYCALQRYETARGLVKTIAERDDPNKAALKIYLTLIYADYKNSHDFTERLIHEFPRLGKKEWCSIWGDPEYLNFLLLEDLKLKKFYNCNCEGTSDK